MSFLRGAASSSCASGRKPKGQQGGGGGCEKGEIVITAQTGLLYFVFLFYFEALLCFVLWEMKGEGDQRAVMVHVYKWVVHRWAPLKTKPTAAVSYYRDFFTCYYYNPESILSTRLFREAITHNRPCSSEQASSSLLFAGNWWAAIRGTKERSRTARGGNRCNIMQNSTRLKTEHT